MSYLLTEIALEMLGYKFYDVDGNIGPTSFQENSISKPCHIVPDESLQSILGFGVDTEMGMKKTHLYREINESGKSSQPRPNIPVQVLSQASTYPAGLEKLLNLEYGRLLCQTERVVHREKESVISSNSDSLRDGNLTQDVLKAFILKEKEKLVNEAQTLQAFRKLVENTAFKMNKDIYKQYKAVFSGNNK
ncbi:uncharacterized protein [Eurosta solidaginis]|uniref:uncharacterized protein n=1 Tax=Eurosta solidaginis TaxID=178769 RepID=UPI00353104CA